MIGQLSLVERDDCQKKSTIFELEVVYKVLNYIMLWKNPIPANIQTKHTHTHTHTHTHIYIYIYTALQ